MKKPAQAPVPGAKKTIRVLGLFDLEVDPAKQKPAVATTSPATHPEAMSQDVPAPPPRVISSLVPGRESGGPVAGIPKQTKPSAPTGRMAKLLDAIRANLPEDNHAFRLRDALKPLESAIPDASQRRTIALQILSAHGVTEESVTAGTNDIRNAINAYLNDLLLQANQAREEDAGTARTQAATFRSEIDSNTDEINRLKREIETLTEANATLEQQATELESSASERESELEDFKKDVEIARAHALGEYDL